MQSPEEYLRSAEKSLELMRRLAGEGPLSGRDFLEGMSRSDEGVEHDGATCGQCHHLRLGAQIAREMLAAERYGAHVVGEWAEETKRRWQQGQFFQLWQEEQAAGRDPEEAFRERGWEP